MKIKLSDLRKVIKEELVSINETKVGVDDRPVMSWIKFVGGAPGYHEDLERIWNLIRSGEYTKDDLNTVPSELHRGIRFHTTFKNMHQKAKQGVVYPTWDEVINKLRELVAQQKAEEEVRKIARNKDTVVIAGIRVKLAPKDDISNKVYATKMRLSGVPHADTHELWQAKKGESPEQTVSRLRQRASGSFPGEITLYQDPDIEEVFAHAVYNTF